MIIINVYAKMLPGSITSMDTCHDTHANTKYTSKSRKTGPNFLGWIHFSSNFTDKFFIISVIFFFLVVFIDVFQVIHQS